MIETVKALLDALDEHRLELGCESYYRGANFDAFMGPKIETVKAALSAQSTGSGGVAAEPVAGLAALRGQLETTEADIRWFSQNSPTFMFKSERHALERLVRDHKRILSALAAEPGAGDEPPAVWIRRAIMANLRGEADGVDEAVAIIVSNLEALAAAPTPPAGGGETDDFNGAPRKTPLAAFDEDAAELAASERISAAQVAYDQAMEDYDPSAPDHEVHLFDAMKAAIAAADALAPAALLKKPSADEKSSRIQKRVSKLVRLVRSLRVEPVDRLNVDTIVTGLEAVSALAFTPAAPRKGPSEERPTVSIGAFHSDNSDYVVLVIKPKDEPARRMRVSKGGAEVLMAELSALLTPADRGETQAVGDGWQPISTAPKDGSDILSYCSTSGEQFVVCFIDANWQFAYYDPTDCPIVCDELTHWRPLPKPPSPDQNRGEPDQGGANTEAGR